LKKYLQKHEILSKSPRGKISFFGPGHYPFIHMQKIVQDKFGYTDHDFPVLNNQVGSILNFNVEWTKEEKEIKETSSIVKEYFTS
jgi:hypothetical protein